MAEEFKVKDIYQGGYQSLKPSYGDIFTGYHVSAGSLGITTDPRSADILSEVSSKIAPGIKNVEIELVDTTTTESIPQHLFKEVNRLSKVTGVDVSVHGPVIEASGMTKEGYSDANREAVERQMNLTVERSHELSPDGNIPVTFHSSAMLPGPEMKKTKDGFEVDKMLVINQETGQMNAVKKETKFYPYMEELKPGVEEKYLAGKIKEKDIGPKHFDKISLDEGKVYSVEKQLESMNNTEWENALTGLISPKEQADKIIRETSPMVQDIFQRLSSKKEIQPQDLAPPEQEVISRFNNAKEILDDVKSHLSGSFNKAWKYGTPEDKERLKQISEDFGQTIKRTEKVDLEGQSRALQNLMEGLRKFKPETYKSLDEFSEEKTTQTFANVALNSYKKFGDKAPIISIENPPAGGAFSTGEELKNIVEKSREKFIENAIKPKSQGGLGIGKDQAKKQAEKLLGVTWDVGHINMLRKHGFESKDIIKETEKVAPFVKHVHLSDNFGFEHTELPMGMGNVPFKEMMEKINQEGFEGKKIIEAAQWWQHFKSSPVAESMKAMGSPIYSMQMQPYWNQAVGLQQGYAGGLEGTWLPTANYAAWGSGFSSASLPMELGGQMPGAGGSRFSGQGME